MATFEERTTKTGEKRIRAVIRRAGKTIRGTFENKKKAREWAEKTETAIRAGQYGLSDNIEDHLVSEMIDRYIDNVLPYKSKKERYPRQMKQRLLWWKAQCGKLMLSDLTKPVIIEKRELLSKIVTPDTVNCYLSALSIVLNTAVDEWEWLKISPMLGVKRMKGSKGRTRYLKDEERPSFLDACKLEKKKPLYLIAVLCLSVGARKEEITALPLKNVDIVRGRLETEETKNGEKKTFFITGYALELLRQYVEENKHFKRKYLFSNRTGTRPMLIDREFRRARKRAGVEDFVFHDLRHTHASYLAILLGATPKLIAEALGQKTVNQANRYTHLSRGHVADQQASMTDQIFNNKTEGEHHA